MKLPEIEEIVGAGLRAGFTFACIGVDTADERLSLERGLIALLAQHPLGRPSERWLGRRAASPVIRQTGLWNTQGVAAPPLTRAGFTRLEELVAET